MTTEPTQPKKPTNPHAKAWTTFLDMTDDHKLVVVQDIGIYRHLRMKAPRTRNWSWDIVTWPGHLATSGDIADGYTFTCERDMIKGFFGRYGPKRDYYSDGAPAIDARYWAGKLCGGRSQDVKEHSPEKFIAEVTENFEEMIQDETLTKKEAAELMVNAQEHKDSHHEAVAWMEDCEVYWPHLFKQEVDRWLDRESVLNGNQTNPETDRIEQLRSEAQIAMDNEEDAMGWLTRPRASPGPNADACYDSAFSDIAHIDLTEYRSHFLYACYAIDLTVQRYLELRRTTSANDDHIVAVGRSMENDPALPIFDMEPLERLPADATQKDYLDVEHQLQGLFERIIEHTMRTGIPMTPGLVEITDQIRARTKEHGDHWATGRLTELDENYAAHFKQL